MYNKCSLLIAAVLYLRGLIGVCVFCINQNIINLSFRANVRLQIYFFTLKIIDVFKCAESIHLKVKGAFARNHAVSERGTDLLYYIL